MPSTRAKRRSGRRSATTAPGEARGSGPSAATVAATTMQVEQMRESRAPRLVGARRQIGGAVSCAPSDLTPALLESALGLDGAMLTRQRRLVAEWDACVLDGQLVHDWDAIVRAGRLADVSGAFAVAWLDEDGAVHLARDAAGERSLFYLRDGERFIFASTVRALVASGAAAATVDASALPAYLTYGYVPGRQTLVEGVREVLPGEHVAFAGGRVTTHRFWALPREDEETCSDESYCSQLRSLLEDSAVQRLPDGGPLAATLSGGIDSSVVVAPARRLHDGPMTAYSLSFGPGIPNEVAFASLVAEHCRVPHKVIDLTPRSVMDRFDRTLGSLSTPIGEPLTVANALLFETIAADSPVALNGEGGDPCFGGPKNMPMLLREVFGPRPGETTKSFRERGYLATHKKCFDELDRIFAPDVATGAAQSMTCELEPHFADERWSTLVNRLTALNITSKGGHHILPKVDHLSRAAGVLGRSPFFYRRIVQS